MNIEIKMTNQSKKHVCVIGAGIAGLTAAHELVRKGYSVSVFEAEPDAGGFFRSARLPEHDGMPSEYSWHGFGPWYTNTFDVLRQITVPSDYYPMVAGISCSRSSTLKPWTTPYLAMLSRPINFGLAFDDGTAEFESPRRMFRLGWIDAVRGAWLMLKTWTADDRSHVRYSQISASDAWRSRLSDRSWRAWRSCFGPWVGSDWTRVSVHHVGLFFRRNFFSGKPHEHAGWTHGSRDGWLVLRGPSSSAWFEPWVAALEAKGVKFYFGHRLDHLKMAGGAAEISNAVFEVEGQTDQTWADADHYVLAISPFAASSVFDRSWLKSWDNDGHRTELSVLHTQHRDLTQDGPHTQVSFRIAFSEPIAWKIPRQAVVLADSEWNITIFAQEQAWGSAGLGDGVQALWTGTACVSSVPGRLHGKPLERCTLGEFEQEVMAQIIACDGLWSQTSGSLGTPSKIGRIALLAGTMIRFEVWHEWLFSAEGITPKQPKWVTTTNTQRHKPDQRTAISNLVLAGAHTKTDADVWSIEGAVESGRRAAKLIVEDDGRRVWAPGGMLANESVSIIPQHKPVLLRAVSAVDNLAFRLRLPHVLDIAVVLALLLAAIVLI